MMVRVFKIETEFKSNNGNSIVVRRGDACPPLRPPVILDFHNEYDVLLKSVEVNSKIPAEVHGAAVEAYWHLYSTETESHTILRDPIADQLKAAIKFIADGST